MKACTNCRRELPDTALHCSFCGTKQAAFLPPEVNKTVMGYSAAQMRDHLQKVGAVPPAGPPVALKIPAGAAPAAYPAAPPPMAVPQAGSMHRAGAPASGPAPMTLGAPVGSRPAMVDLPTMMSSVPAPAARPAPVQRMIDLATMAPTSGHAPTPPAAQAPGRAAADLVFGGLPTMAPTSGPGSMSPFAGPPVAGHNAPASAATQLAQPALISPQPIAGPNASALPHPSQEPVVLSPIAGGDPLAGIPSPGPRKRSPTNMRTRARPATADRGPRPVEPYAASLRLLLIVLGVMCLAAFVTPLVTKPGMVFWWDVLGSAPSGKLLVGLSVAALGVLGVVFGSVPVAPAIRGVLALVVGALGVAAGLLAQPDATEWHVLVLALAPVALAAGLVLRAEYKQAVLPRVLATVGALALLATVLVPVHGDVPLVGLLTHLGDLKDNALVVALVVIAYTLVVAACLLVWLPAPSSAGARPLAWIIFALPLVMHALMLGGSVGFEHVPDAISLTPFDVAARWIPETAALIFSAFGLATLFGKQLERA